MTTAQITAAHCPTSKWKPNGELVHWWKVTEKVETCRYCGTSRPWTIDGIPAGVLATGNTKGSPLSPAIRIMREQIMALDVGEECVSGHSHLVCRLYPNGSVERCGLSSTLKSLRSQVNRERDWHLDHGGTDNMATAVRLR